MEQSSLDKRRVLIFLAFAFGIAWITALVIYLTGGLQNSPVIVPGITLALILLSGVYMFAPALAHVLTRIVTREGWQDAHLRPNFRRSWRYWLIAWLLPPVLVILGAALYFVIFPQHFDPSLSIVNSQLDAMAQQTGQPVPIAPWQLIAVQLVAALFVSLIVNSLFTFGEEFGWLGYLQPKLMTLGPRRALLLTGVIWGVWHWPVIFMGYEYGFEYPGAPWVGPLLFVYIAVLLAVMIGWVSLRGGSVWPAVIAHALFNGFAGTAVLFMRGEPNPLLGPLPVGVIAALPMTLLAAWILFSPRALRSPEAAA